MITTQLRKRGGLEDQAIPSCAQLLCRWRDTSAPEERRWFISHVGECVNFSLVLNKIRPCFLPMIRNVYFLTDFHATALLLWMHHYLSHLPSLPPPWLWGSASCRQLSCQVCMDLSETRWAEMERSLLAAAFALLAVCSRPVCRDAFQSASHQGQQEEWGEPWPLCAPQQGQNPWRISLPPAVCLEYLSPVAHLFLAACSALMAICHHWGWGVRKRRVGWGSSSNDRLGGALFPALEISLLLASVVFCFSDSPAVVAMRIFFVPFFSKS